jgi:hypothetical protein
MEKRGMHVHPETSPTKWVYLHSPLTVSA